MNEEVAKLVHKLKVGSNWLSGNNSVYSYNKSPKLAAKLLEVLGEVSISELITDLRKPTSWRVEGYGHWKDVTTSESNAPFEAANYLEELLKNFNESQE